MNVLSLFDGCSVGFQALKELDIKIDNYFASEIDKYAIEVSKYNHPEIIHLGDVKNFESWDLPDIDLIIGGSPCQGFSFAGKQLNFNDPRSALFFEFDKAIRHFKPKNFMLENTKMSKQSSEVISRFLGVEPILINSSLVTAQNRERLYWTDIEIKDELKDLNISLSDVVGKNVIGAAMRGRYIDTDKKITKQFIELRNDNKSNCLTTASKNALYVESYKLPEKHSNDHYGVKEIEWQYLSPEHYEQLQGLPIGYTSCVSDSQRKKILGNGWTVPVIKHILGGLK